MIETGAHFTTFPVEGWHDCGKQETVLATNKFLLDRGSGSTSRILLENSIIIQPCHIGEGAKINNSVIGPYATVAEDSEVSDSIIRNTIIGSGAIVEQVVIEGSLIGSRARLLGSFSSLSIGDSSDIQL